MIGHTVAEVVAYAVARGSSPTDATLGVLRATSDAMTLGLWRAGNSMRALERVLFPLVVIKSIENTAEVVRELRALLPPASGTPGPDVDTTELHADAAAARADREAHGDNRVVAREVGAARAVEEGNGRRREHPLAGAAETVALDDVGHEQSIARDE